jgi:hypothetical protein
MYAAGNLPTDKSKNIFAYMTFKMDSEVGKGFELDLAILLSDTERTAKLRNLMLRLRSF